MWGLVCFHLWFRRRPSRPTQEEDVGTYAAIGFFVVLILQDLLKRRMWGQAFFYWVIPRDVLQDLLKRRMWGPTPVVFRIFLVLQDLLAKKMGAEHPS